MDEQSKALPAHFYRNPADIVEHQQLKDLGCRACAKAESLLGRVVCTEERKRDTKGIPKIGHNCKFFILKGQ